jgi:hypothetical protein
MYEVAAMNVGSMQSVMCQNIFACEYHLVQVINYWISVSG